MPDPDCPAASRTLAVPVTLVRNSCSRSRFGWSCQARWTTASTPASAARSRGKSASTPTSRVCHSTPRYGAREVSGSLRLMPTSSRDPGFDSSCLWRLWRTAVPTFPLAPVIAIRIAGFSLRVAVCATSTSSLSPEALFNKQPHDFLLLSLAAGFRTQTRRKRRQCPNSLLLCPRPFRQFRHRRSAAHRVGFAHGRAIARRPER